MNSDDAPSTAKPISGAAVTALILGLAALVLIPVAAGMYPIALILGAAAIILGIVAVVNSRRGTGGGWLAYAGSVAGLVAVILVAILSLT